MTEVTAVVSKILDIIAGYNKVLKSHEESFLKYSDLLDKQNDEIELLKYRIQQLEKELS